MLWQKVIWLRWRSQRRSVMIWVRTPTVLVLYTLPFFHSGLIWQSLNCSLKSPFSCTFWRTPESHTLSVVLTSGFLYISSKLSSLSRIFMERYTGIVWEHLSLHIVPSFLTFPLFMRKSNYCGNNHDLWATGTIFTYLLPGKGTNLRKRKTIEERLPGRLFSTHWVWPYKLFNSFEPQSPLLYSGDDNTSHSGLFWCLKGVRI